MMTPQGRLYKSPTETSVRDVATGEVRHETFFLKSGVEYSTPTPPKDQHQKFGTRPRLSQRR